MICQSLLFVVFVLCWNAVYCAIQSRIYGGRETTIEQHPHQVSVEENGAHICGGSIISPNWILSAAHCFESSTRPYRFRAGSAYRGKGGTVRRASRIILHPKYNGHIRLDFDVALIQVANPFPLTAKIKPIPLVRTVPAEGTAVTVTGWGLDETENLTNKLQEVTIKIVGREECQRSHPYVHVTDRMICAGFPEGGKDSCLADSGGPLVVKKGQVGIVSWGGQACGTKGEYGVYTNIPKIYNWVYTVMRNS